MYIDGIRDLVDAIEIRSLREVRWLGQDLDELGELPDDLAAEALTTFVSSLLYQSYYVYGAPQGETAAAEEQNSTLSKSSRFLDKLLNANRGAREWALDCAVGHDGTRMTADIWGIRFTLPTELASTGRPDGTLRVRMPGVLAMNSPGYVMFFGDRGPRKEAGRTARLYWNITAPGASALVSGLTDALNDAAVEFQLKVRYGDNPWTDRADPAVLYLDRDDLVRCWPSIAAVARDLRPLLRPYTPALTRVLAHGLGYAEDPGGASSYGTAVCELLARGLVAAYEARANSVENRTAWISRAFAEAGRTLDRPYLEPGSAEIDLTSIVDAADRQLPPSPTGRDEDWIARADQLGRRVSAQALWSGNRCVWLQPSLEPGDGTFRPATAEVYNGLAGIGLLFAYLTRATGDSHHRRTTVGAVLQAQHAAERLPHLGLYAGSPGTGLAIALAGQALDDEQMFRDGAAIVRKNARSCLSSGRVDRFDVVYGAAGSIVSLVRLHQMGDDDAAELAAQLGHELIANAVRTDHGCSWRDGGSPGEPVGLTGMAHGSAGAIWALAELAELTGDPAFAESAMQACSDESSRFDDTMGNWPDVRQTTGRAVAQRDRYDWCYGAPGIGLSRIRLAAATGWKQATADMAIAVSRTRAAAAAFPRYGHGVGLCHGAAGLSEIMSLIPATSTVPADDRLRRDLVAAAMETYDDDGPWPDGCGLMLGATGVAFAALRIDEPDTPSPLWWASGK